MYTTCVHIFQYLYTIYTHKIWILKWFTREISIIWFHFSYKMWGGTLIRYQPHPLSRSPFHAFNVLLVSCGHFRSHFGQNVISSLSMPMVSNRPYSFLVIVFMPEVIGRRGFWRGARKTIISFSFSPIMAYNKTMDRLVIKKNCTFILKEKKIVLSFGQKKKIVLRGKNPDPPLVMKWEAPYGLWSIYGKTRFGRRPFCLCKLAGLSYEFGMSSKQKYLE